MLGPKIGRPESFGGAALGCCYWLGEGQVVQVRWGFAVGRSSPIADGLEHEPAGGNTLLDSCWYVEVD